MTDPNQHEAPAPSDSLSARPALQREGTRSAPLLREPQVRRTPEQTLAKVVARFEAAGGRVEFTRLETVADRVVEGIRADRFWMMGPPTPAEGVVSRKAASILVRGAPDYLVGVLGQSAEKEPGNAGPSPGLAGAAFLVRHVGSSCFWA